MKLLKTLYLVLVLSALPGGLASHDKSTTEHHKHNLKEKNEYYNSDSVHIDYFKSLKKCKRKMERDSSHLIITLGMLEREKCFKLNLPESCRYNSRLDHCKYTSIFYQPLGESFEAQLSNMMDCMTRISDDISLIKFKGLRKEVCFPSKFIGLLDYPYFSLSKINDSEKNLVIGSKLESFAKKLIGKVDSNIKASANEFVKPMLGFASKKSATLDASDKDTSADDPGKKDTDSFAVSLNGFISDKCSGPAAERVFSTSINTNECVTFQNGVPSSPATIEGKPIENNPISKSTNSSKASSFNGQVFIMTTAAEPKLYSLYVWEEATGDCSDREHEVLAFENKPFNSDSCVDIKDEIIAKYKDQLKGNMDAFGVLSKSLPFQGYSLYRLDNKEANPLRQKMNKFTKIMLTNLTPSDSVRGMKILDRSMFNLEVPIIGIKIKVNDLNVVSASLSQYKLSTPRFKSIVSLEGSTLEKLLLLDPSLDFNDYPSTIRSYIYNLYKNQQEKAIAYNEYSTRQASSNIDFFDKRVDLNDKGSREEFNLVLYIHKIDYKHWVTDEIITAILPDEIEKTHITTSYEAVGHIAHMNLRDQCLEYKNIIGQVVLDKNKHIKTVVNKTSNIHAVFRYFEYELIAGEENMVATVKENTCTFTFDYSKVYWNSRLEFEHTRLINLFPINSVVCDMMCGVGPFALPSAVLKKCTVYANDLNINSYNSLIQNRKNNNIPISKVTAFNMDSKEFVKRLIEMHCEDPESTPLFEHAIMNLPASAVKFLHVFKGLYLPVLTITTKENIILPTIHCYTFSKGQLNDEAYKRDGLNQASLELGYPLTLDSSTVTIVRNVAPNKYMLCISFQLPAEVAFLTPSSPDSADPHIKRTRIE